MDQNVMHYAVPYSQISSCSRRPPADRPIARPSFSRFRDRLSSLAFGALLTAAQLLSAQTATPSPAAAVAPTEALRPTLSRINEVLASLTVGRWKAPGEVRAVAQRDIDSIQRDIASTLPPLLDQAAAPAPSVAAYFAVFRNIDALYDVLLRVSETATLAGPQSDADALQGALTSLEGSRRSLGDAILSAASDQEREINALRQAAAQAAAAEAAKPVAPPTKTVVVDGPAASSKTASTAKKKKKVPATTTPADSTSSSGAGTTPPPQ
jgi:hypothetical protein